MRLPILILALALTSCATKPKHATPDVTPTAQAVFETAASISKAQAKAQALKPSVAPEGLETWREMTEALEEATSRAALASTELTSYAGKVSDRIDSMSKEIEGKNQALEKANKSLKFWKTLATSLGLVVVGITALRIFKG
jgi:hypothetical protein